MKTTLTLSLFLFFSTFLGAQLNCFEVEWSQIIGSSGQDNIDWLKITDEGTLYASGYRNESDYDFIDVETSNWIGNFSPNGEIQNIFSVPAFIHNFDAYQSSDNEVSVAMGGGLTIPFIFQTLNNQGDEIATHDYTSEFGSSYSYSSIEKLPDGNFIVAIQKGLNEFEKTLFLKLTPEGEILWNQFISVPVFSIVVSPIGDIYTAASPRRNNQISTYIEISKYNSDAIEQWTSKINNVEIHQYHGGNRGKLSLTEEGNVLCPGRKITSINNSVGFLCLVNPEGNVVWTREYSIGTSLVSTVETEEGDIVSIGFKEQGGTDVDIWLMKTDNLGNIQCSEYFGNPICGDYGCALVKGTDGSIYGGATLRSSCNTNPNFDMRGGDDIWLFKLGQALINNTDKTLDQALQMNIFPNPVDNSLKIQFPEIVFTGQLEILDMMGKTIIQQPVHQETQFEINTAKLSAGTYLIKILHPTNGMIQIEKFIKM